MSNDAELIIRASVFEQFIDTYLSIVDEARLEFNDKGIYCEVIDPANVAMVAQTLDAGICESYECGDEFTVGINLERLSEFLSKANSDDLVRFGYERETGTFEIEYGSASFDMAGIASDSIRQGDTMDRDVVENMPVDIDLDAAAWTHAIDIAGMTSDHITLNSDPDREKPVHVIGEGDTDNSRVEFDDALQEGSTVGEAAVSKFSYDYLEDLNRVLPSAPIRVRHGDEWPMVITYTYAEDYVDVEIGVAPRITRN